MSGLFSCSFIAVAQNGQLGMYDTDGASGAVIRFVSAGGVEAVDALMNTFHERPRVLEDALVRLSLVTLPR